MNLTQVSQKLAELTQKFQLMLNLAKRVEELPVQETLVATSKVHVSNGGLSQSLEIRKIIEAFAVNEANKIISIETIERVGNDFTVPPGAQWMISGIEATNLAPFEFTLQPAADGYKRIDLLIVRLAGFEIVTGTPSQDIYTSPDIPNTAGAILVKEYKVDGGNIDSGSDPVIGEPFILKNQFNTIAASPDHKFYLDQKSSYLITDPAITEIEGIFITGTADSESYTGKLGFFMNCLNVPVKMKHLKAGIPVQFDFARTQGDYFIQPGEMLFFAEDSYAVAELNRWKCLNERASSSTDTDDQITVDTSRPLGADCNKKILKIKADATVTIPAGLPKSFSCVFDAWEGTMNLVAGAGTSIVEAELSLLPGKMATLYKDGENEVFKFKGETS